MRQGSSLTIVVARGVKDNVAMRVQHQMSRIEQKNKYGDEIRIVCVSRN